MSRPFNLPISCHPVVLSPVATTNGGVTTTAITLKQGVKAWLYVHLTNAVGFAQVITPMQATNVAAGTSAVLPAVPIWANEDVVASDALVAQTAAANYTTAAVAKKKLVIFEIDPACLTPGYTSIFVTLSNSAQATNFALVEAHVWQNNAVASPPSALID